MTKRHLLAELRRLLARPDTSVVEKKLRICGHSKWDSNDETGDVTNIRIVFDPRRDGRVRLVIHELLHIYMDREFGLRSRMEYEIEETAVLAWEARLYEWLHNPKRAVALESWSRAIERKMR